MYSKELLEELESFYEHVDRQTSSLFNLHNSKLQCRRGCSSCCQDDIEVFGVEAALIEHNHKGLLEQGVPAEEGACAFLDKEGACRIYDSRPFICRAFGLPLRWVEGPKRNQKDIRSICALNFENDSIYGLPINHCLSMDELEDKLVLLQMKSGQTAIDKVSLRTLFFKS